MKPRQKKCDICGEIIQNRRSTLQVVCSPKCAAELAKKKEAARRSKETRRMKRELMTHSDWLNLLQKVFNSYIRKRDQNKPCISCGKPIKGKADAGHFFSVGAHPELRFDEDNVFRQCVPCNRHLHGNLIEYAERLPLRIGIESFEALKARRGQVSKPSIPEIQELIKHYKQKIKEL